MKKKIKITIDANLTISDIQKKYKVCRQTAKIALKRKYLYLKIDTNFEIPENFDFSNIFKIAKLPLKKFKIKNAIHKLVRSNCQFTIDDLVQEAIIRIFSYAKKIKEIEDNIYKERFMSKIAEYYYIDFIRKYIRREKIYKKFLDFKKNEIINQLLQDR